MLEPAGPAADIIIWLWWGMFAFFTLVLLVVSGLWLYAMQRHPQDVSPRDAAITTKRWIIGGGIALPLVSIIVLLGVGIPAGQQILTLPDERAALRVDVHAHRWWWSFHQPDGDITTANQLTIPVDTPIEFYVHSDNVIHSFWVPKLGGKIDVVPGRVNTIRLRASQTGLFRGQCAEFCGTGHAHMVFQVKVLSQNDFALWQERQRQPASIPSKHQKAAEAFAEHCGQCHTIKGVSQGNRAPDLSNIGARRLMNVGARLKQDISIEQWMKTHPTWLRGGQTPHHKTIAPNRMADIVTWLETLD
ncbi:cytochrome c oxidase subunit II [Gilvimarinus sp. 1_MG-2023]|uniref:cytochrome c oxidase subunit II n=1 Tax=Gilvimarinus sp. 1_MG-2023 TaxID=3062638 RepID=UPI0026E488BB|nr:cytochrome c oxidase subunit II [Gilvimarinus sp. 1_MG-2023]MDO6746449.1 cytochrome c oxidase subunit II [Gilvimarinus sp. 1_MG-2023]